MDPNKRPTVYDIAKIAGVSVATVSRVLNNFSMVKSTTRQAVLAAADQLHYQYDRYPVTLAVRDRLLVANLPSLSNPFYSDIIIGAQLAALRNGFNLLINQQELFESNINSFIKMLGSVGAAGVIVINSMEMSLMDVLAEQTCVVQCCEFDEKTNRYSYVGIDDDAATTNVMEYILSTGHRKVALLSGPPKYKYSIHRKRAYLSTLEKAGIEPRNDWIIHIPDVDFHMALSAASKLLSGPERPTAIFTVSDIYAAAVIRAAKEANLRVPEDIAVTGFDNVNISETVTPSITTVSQPRHQMGYLACELLVERILTPEAPTQQILLNTELIIRESTGFV